MSLTAVFAALHVVMYFVSFGLWRNWGIYLASIEGIILGPNIGFLAAFLGSSAARLIKPDIFWMFGIVAEPLSVLAVGFLARAKWKPVLAIYAVMLSAYFIHPIGRALPIWTILDILVALLLIYPAAMLSRKPFGTSTRSLAIMLVFTSFVGVALDSLVRVFLLVPCGFHNLFPEFFGSFDQLFAVFVIAAADSYIEDALVIIFSVLVGVPILVSISKSGIFDRKGKVQGN